ncbi:hypothetical protein [Mycobacterium sp.]|uniref:hypothetical protein n=1 Tax=Mycobacterium sp. TaxID=1785 RepID=UPI0011F63BCE|nr:hypothetical protein [Mycobacterium sp.]TAM73155.1 MAG: hypothetical protein EPN51_00675 [Mycobacterium sp.]
MTSRPVTRGRVPPARRLPQVSNSHFVRPPLAAPIRGGVAVIPPGRRIGEAAGARSAAREDR